MNTQTIRTACKRVMVRPVAFSALLCCGLAILFVGCATEISNHTFLKQPYPAKASDFVVEIFTNGLPAKSFERIATLDVHCEGQGFVDPTIEKAIPVFIKQARAAGCDAVIEIKEAPTPANWTFETRVRHYTGIGIIYK